MFNSDNQIIASRDNLCSNGGRSLPVDYNPVQAKPELDIDLTDLPEGVYMLRISTDKAMISKPFVKN